MSAGAAAPRPAPNALSALLAELASAPERDLRDAWDRGHRPGEVIGRFEILHEIGRGGFGIVFEALDRELGRRVAFKAIRPGARARDPANEELLRREAEAAAQLQHPSIVTLFDVGRCESGPFLILELLRGETLAERLVRGPLPPHEAVRIATEVACALVHAHEQGVLHRDLKPSNVFLTAGGGVKVLDFGLAHILGAGNPARSGTPGYMAPEQVRGEPQDARTDVFAVGVLLHEMISGSRFAGPAGPRAAAPRLDAPGVPPALSALVASAVEADPTGRPRDAQALLEGLTAVDRSLGVKRRRAATWAGFAAAVVLAAAAGVLWQGTRSRAPARIVVAVADFANATGDPDLDGLSGMLITSLEQSRRLSVVPRQRLLDLATPAGHPRPARLDEAAARGAAARARAGALLLPAARSQDGAYSVELRGVEPLRGKELFLLREEGQGAASVPALIDRLSDRTRYTLQESDAERRASEVRVGKAITSNLEAYRHYFLGEQCAARPVYGQDCGAALRRAVTLDPAFTAAWYELAVWARHFGGSRTEQQAAIAAALRNADRAPEKERVLIRAWAAHLDGRDDEALSLYRLAAQRWPDDRRTAYELADHLVHRDEWDAAVPWFERAVAMDPEFGWALAHLADALGVTQRRDALREWARRWEDAPSPTTLHALSLAHGWLGDVAAAAAAARRGIDMGLGAGAGEDLVAAQVFSGAYAEAERMARALAGRGSAVRPIGFYALAALAAYQGRPRAGLAQLDALRRELPSIENDAVYWELRADYLLGGGDVAAVWGAVEALQRIDPHAAAEHAPGLAWLGDLAHAGELARGLPAGSPLAATYGAIVLWHRGDADGALERLRAISAKTPVSVWRVAPLYLYADLASRAGRDAEAVEALRRAEALYVPRMMWRSWAHPRSLYLLARSYERLGDRERALEGIEQLLAAWVDAEPGEPLLRDARALRDRLGSHRARPALPPPSR